MFLLSEVSPIDMGHVLNPKERIKFGGHDGSHQSDSDYIVCFFTFTWDLVLDLMTINTPILCLRRTGDLKRFSSLQFIQQIFVMCPHVPCVVRDLKV